MITLGWVSATNEIVSFVQCRNEDGVEVDRPDAVVGFFRSHLLLHERVGEREQLVRLWADPSQQLLREPRDDVKHPVDDLGDVELHPGAHQESDLAAR